MPENVEATKNVERAGRHRKNRMTHCHQFLQRRVPSHGKLLVFRFFGYDLIFSVLLPSCLVKENLVFADEKSWFCRNTMKSIFNRQLTATLLHFVSPTPSQRYNCCQLQDVQFLLENDTFSKLASYETANRRRCWLSWLNEDNDSKKVCPFRTITEKRLHEGWGLTLLLHE